MKKGKNILFVGDIHGVNDWEEIVKNGLKQFYEIVFLGDYVDSFFVRPVEQIHNLKNLVTFFRKYKDKRVTALIGNHDYAYIHSKSYVSGYQPAHAYEYRKIFEDNIDLFDIAWGYTNESTGKYTLATHAGLTKTYWNRYVIPEIKEGGFVHSIVGDQQLPIHEVLNYLKDKDILWKIGNVRGGSGTPGPLWADYLEFLEDRFEGINQIFGHTAQPSVRVTKMDDDLIACIDSWGNKKTASLIITL